MSQCVLRFVPSNFQLMKTSVWVSEWFLAFPVIPICLCLGGADQDLAATSVISIHLRRPCFLCERGQCSSCILGHLAHSLLSSAAFMGQRLWQVRTILFLASVGIWIFNPWSHLRETSLSLLDDTSSRWQTNSCGNRGGKGLFRKHLDGGM